MGMVDPIMPRWGRFFIYNAPSHQTIKTYDVDVECLSFVTQPTQLFSRAISKFSRSPFDSFLSQVWLVLRRGRICQIMPMVIGSHAYCWDCYTHCWELGVLVEVYNRSYNFIIIYMS